MDFINKNLRVLNITHSDLDGVVSSIVIRNYFKTVDVLSTNYGKDEKALKYAIDNRNKFDCIIFTDYTPSNLGQFQEILPTMVLDHHESVLPLNNPEKNIFISKSCCGSLLTYKYFNRWNELVHLEDLINITNDYDLFLLKDPKSVFFNGIFWKMGFEWFGERFLKGNINLYPEEMEFLKRYKKDYKEHYDNLEITELPNKGVFCICEKYIGETSIDLRKDGYEYLLIFHGGNSISLRSSNDKINFTNVCKRLNRGGGHRLAAGFPIYSNDNIQDIVKKICNEVEFELKNN